MRYYVGTSGYSYKEWKGHFYPRDLPARDMLKYYGGHFSTVEINNTFYRMPGEDLLKGWARQVPPDFRFILKAPRKITHTRPLREKGDETGHFIRISASLGTRLGGFLFQLPPYLHRDLDLLADFVTLLPSGTKAAFEFRHRSWFDDSVYTLLQDNGFALCWSDSEPEEPNRFVVTADWGYARLRKPDYPDADLIRWAETIRAQNWQTVYVFFKHEDEAAGPEFATHLLDLLNPT